MPTALEIAEGIAYRRHIDAPEDPALLDAYRDAFNALQAAQGIKTSVFRCQCCCVTQYGKMAGQQCGHCRATLQRTCDSAERFAHKDARQDFFSIGQGEADSGLLEMEGP